MLKLGGTRKKIYKTTTKKVGHSVQKWEIATSRLGHCDFEIGALRLGHSGSGAFRPHSESVAILYSTVTNMGPTTATSWWPFSSLNVLATYMFSLTTYHFKYSVKSANRMNKYLLCILNIDNLRALKKHKNPLKLS